MQINRNIAMLCMAMVHENLHPEQLEENIIHLVSNHIQDLEWKYDVLNSFKYLISFFTFL